MRIVVCVRRGQDGEISPFEASAYETALRMEGEVILLSMGPDGVKPWLEQLCRAGADRGILLTDPLFSGSDTLATAYILSRAMRKLKPDLILCGRKTLVGDTAQTPPMLAALLAVEYVPEVMSFSVAEDRISGKTRSHREFLKRMPAVLSMERICTLRLPSIFSKIGAVEQWDREEIGAKEGLCGLSGSPTRVVETCENNSGFRKCTFLPPEKFLWALEQNTVRQPVRRVFSEKLARICVVGKELFEIASGLGECVIPLSLRQAPEMADTLMRLDPDAVLWKTDPESRTIAAQTAARMGVGLCADCTDLETDGTQLLMVRPALSGSVIAKVKSIKRPAMATVCTDDDAAGQIVVAAGYGAAWDLKEIRRLTKLLGGTLCASRKAVDRDLLPYPLQVGLTGMTVAPRVYIALGISGAVHHIVGMSSSGTVIAVNRDRDAPIFRYADYGFVTDIQSVLNVLQEGHYEL